MALPLEQVVKQLTDSGIIAKGKLEPFIPPNADPKTVEELVKALVQSNNLTSFQGQQVKVGKARALILGNYTILDKIGAGGMGQVFKAEHRRLKRVVALKMLPPFGLPVRVVVPSTRTYCGTRRQKTDKCAEPGRFVRG
jgi:hypothetical protein